MEDHWADFHAHVHIITYQQNLTCCYSCIYYPRSKLACAPDTRNLTEYLKVYRSLRRLQIKLSLSSDQQSQSAFPNISVIQGTSNLFELYILTISIPLEETHDIKPFLYLPVH